ncbi:Uncharacterised protein [Mycobacteroides abscessus subsp. abscessus]|nr:Uncharacterised protein [Mycobacteroides abscessus subsp. abscessus]SIA78571.1 Uncharacterised protein [Mycobacteroides abscessus subsp. abscessus]SKQ88529.1 Uncharacterised protein [Mycobacteroides abscessus subsp. abscessus]
MLLRPEASDLVASKEAQDLSIVGQFLQRELSDSLVLVFSGEIEYSELGEVAADYVSRILRLAKAIEIVQSLFLGLLQVLARRLHLDDGEPWD